MPDWLAAVVNKLMAKEPAERFSSAAEVVDVLSRHLAALQGAAFVPPPVAEAGLPTSVTLCPTCGASLHVPEAMVGTIVHCEECGKPFHVEEGSAVIQVARGAAAVRAAPRAGGKLRRGVRITCGGAALMLLFLFALFVSFFAIRESRYIAPPVQSTSEARVPGGIRAMAKDELNWLPSGATLFGAIQLPDQEALTLGDARTQALLRLFMRGRTVEPLTSENLGRLDFRGIVLGYYEGTNSEDRRVIVHVSGTALDGHKRIIDFIRRNAGESVRVEELDARLAANGPVRVSGPELSFAVKILDDQRAYLAASLARDARTSQHRKILEQVSSATPLPAGYNPPWIKSALSSIPLDAYGFFLGEIPTEWRKMLIETLQLRVCPRTFVLHIQKEGDGFLLSLNPHVDGANVNLLLQDLEKWRRQGIDSLERKYPRLRKKSDALAQVRQALQSMRWSVHGQGNIRYDMHVSRSTLEALCELFAAGD